MGAAIASPQSRSGAEVTSTADPRAGRRRASLRVALRDGDPLAASRAGSRLRIRGLELTVGELAEARAARGRLGRAIREARWRRRLAEPAATVRSIGRTKRAQARWRLNWVSNVLAGLATIALLVAIFLPRPAPPSDVAPAAAPELVPVEIVQARLGGRGRTTAAITLTAAEPTPAPIPEPTAVPQTPAPTVAPAAPTRVPGGVPSGLPGGVPGASPGGVPGGEPGGTGAATPVPTPNRAPLFSTPAPIGYDRITFRVLDAVTLEPLQDVCIVLGTGDCSLSRPHTNALGLWWMDIPRDAAATFWDVRFFLDGYTSAYTRLTHRPGTSRTIEVRLFRVR